MDSNRRILTRIMEEKVMSIDPAADELSNKWPFLKRPVFVVFIALVLGGIIIFCCVLLSIKLFQRYKVRSNKNSKNKADFYNTSDSESDIEGPQYGRR